MGQHAFIAIGEYDVGGYEYSFDSLTLYLSPHSRVSFLAGRSDIGCTNG